VVCAIQSHDITRQQTEHVRDALAGIVSRMRVGDDQWPAWELAMGLRVQVLQLKNVQLDMEAWSSHIDECLASILDVSQSRLERVAPVVLAQEEQLSGRLLQIERIEKECEQDGVEAAEALSGLSSLVTLVSEHDRIARITRDRLQLLSFNSIIEARNLGSKADVMLEISKNISRVASAWGQMTEKSAETRMEIQRLMDQTHGEITTLSGERDPALQEAQMEITDALGDLRRAAQCVAANAAQVGQLTAGLQERIDMGRSISGSFRKVTAEIGCSIELIEKLRQEVDYAGADKKCDLAALEGEYSQPYTTEIERSILRLALYGETVQAAQPAAMGNEVELF
jgi:hypothetical protein